MHSAGGGTYRFFLDRKLEINRLTQGKYRKRPLNERSWLTSLSP